jgi:hypothetical protein
MTAITMAMATARRMTIQEVNMMITQMMAFRVEMKRSIKSAGKKREYL